MVDSVSVSFYEPSLVDSMSLLVVSLAPLVPTIFPLFSRVPEIGLMFDYESLHLFPPVAV